VIIDLTHLKHGKPIHGIRGQLEDEVDFRVTGVTLRNLTRRLTIFSPYWIMNKTCMQMEYNVSGRKFAENGKAKLVRAREAGERPNNLLRSRANYFLLCFVRAELARVAGERSGRA
jgi:hypothetical protein